MASSRSDYVKKRAIRFQKLRARLLVLYFVPGMVFLLVAIIAIVMDAPTWLQLVVFGIAFALLSAGETKYRCPVCNRTPPGNFNPKSCGHCKTVLRWRNDRERQS